MALLVVALLGSVLSLAPVVAPPPAHAQASLDGIEVAGRVVFDGTTFTPELVRAEPGQTIQFENRSTEILSIADGVGRFVLSPIPAGGGAAIALDTGSYLYEDVVTKTSGRLLVGADGFDVPPESLVEDSIWAGAFPEEDPAQHPVDPLIGAEASTSRIRMTFVPGTTVATAEGVLTRAGVVIAGGMPGSGILLVLVAAGPDHSVLHATLAQLRSEPSVEAAALDPVMTVQAIPPENPNPFTAPDCTGPCPPAPEWTGALTDDGMPIGSNVARWHHEAPRFPQAWNLLGETTGDRVLTAVLELSFDRWAHEDLANLDYEVVCLGDSCSSHIPNSSFDADHGNHVASLISAAPTSWGSSPTTPPSSA